MKRESRLGLQLFPLLASPSTSSEFCTDHSVTCSSTRKQITIFHAQAGVYDTSELQLMAILLLARGELKLSRLGISCFQFQLHRPYGLSLKKSLHKFMQKRRDRIKQIKKDT
ncbi:hypothetical protein BC332_21725 [Capsicum chinense]|nr:hypothetical protein BC332_21725 [Capsicum chinense]